VARGARSSVWRDREIGGEAVSVSSCSDPLGDGLLDCCPGDAQQPLSEES
jgi:hypothetical protein